MTTPLIFLVESLDGDDLYYNEREIEALGEILRCLGVRFRKRNIFGHNHLKKAIRAATKQDATVFHLSCHGDKDGIALLNGDQRTWSQLATDLSALATPNRALTLSTCQGGTLGITPALKAQNTPFGYVFGPREEISIADGCIAWAIIYRTIEQHGLDPDQLQTTLTAINDLLPGRFMNRRWNTTDNKYKKFES
jgi:hypothetical protein